MGEKHISKQLCIHYLNYDSKTTNNKINKNGFQHQNWQQKKINVILPLLNIN